MHLDLNLFEPVPLIYNSDGPLFNLIEGNKEKHCEKKAKDKQLKIESNTI